MRNKSALIRKVVGIVTILIILVWSIRIFSLKEDVQIFIEREMMSISGGIYTNYKDTETSLHNIATGHEVLSESIGLMMLSYVYGDEKDKFSKMHEYLEAHMKMESGLYKWRISEVRDLGYQSNASLDDLRIAKAYLLGYRRWSVEAYAEQVRQISQGLLTYCVKGQYLLNSTDDTHQIDLSYLAIGIMDDLIAYDKRWIGVKAKSLEIIQHGFIEEAFPFYDKEFDVKNKSYSRKDEINMIDTLITVLHLSEEKRVKASTVKWLENRLEEGQVYGSYRSGDWENRDGMESTAVYALIMRIGIQLDHKYLVEKASACRERLQVKDKDSKFYMGFGEVSTEEFYSFDQLQAYLADKEWNKK